ncbi:MAG: hypothetical protein DHS20C16_11600 [Phycisphaerae bacterium]|nr:MAG: hypothetical protein DHS20C16_11600 [Phycisphaerae bacterium]
MKYMRSTRLRVGILLVVGALIPGCQFGPNALKIGQSEYSDALRVATSEQMLVNLVRMRYRDLPVFLGVTSIATQFQFDQSGEAVGTLNENVGTADSLNPNVLRLSGRLGYSEKPTITYSLLGGEAFLRRMLMPISVENISLLAESGWRADRVLRLSVEALNGLPNAPTASGPTPGRVPEYESFAEVMGLIKDMRASGAMGITFIPRRQQISFDLPREKVSSGDLISAAKSGVGFASENGDDRARLVTMRRVLVMQLNESPSGQDVRRRFRDLLSLEGNRREYDIVDEVELADGRNGRDVKDKIGLDTRSLMGVLYFLSQSVDVPEDHIEDGVATQTRRADGSAFDWSEVLDDLFHVHTSRFKPKGAAVAVKHRGRWFYIRDDDEDSKSTFSLLGQLFMLQTGEVTKTDPVLTLPVG